MGDSSGKAKKFASLLLQGAIKKDIPLCYMTSSEAEAVKLFSNTYLALRIAFFNELDTFSELKGLDTKPIIDGVCLDPRIGNFYNNPSFGYGGYCLPKDTHQVKRNYSGIPHSIISAIVKSNKIRKKHIVAMVEKHYPRIVGIYKLTMKAGSDNYRSAAILDIIKKLQKKQILVVIFEPLIKSKRCFKCPVIDSFDEFAKMTDIIITNRMSKELRKYEDKVYTRDIFLRD
jgi:UDPglucose 6-dehydrogenase